MGQEDQAIVSERVKRPLEDALISIQFTPFSWVFTYDVRCAAFDLGVGPFYFTIVWPESFRLKY